MTRGAELPGFPDPVAGAQACFRAVLDALSRPGTIHTIGQDLAPPPSLQPATAAVLLTLVDQDVPLWLERGLEGAAPWLRFHCGARFVPPDQAAFILASRLPEWQALRHGSHEQPEDGATVVLQVAALGRGQAFRLSGPGLAGPRRFEVDGLPPDFTAFWAANHRAFPCGVDVILCAGVSVAALARSVTMEAI